MCYVLIQSPAKGLYEVFAPVIFFFFLMLPLFKDMTDLTDPSWGSDSVREMGNPPKMNLK